MRSARAAAARPSPFMASFARPAPRAVASRFYATEGEAKSEETKSENAEEDKIQKELEAKNKEVVELKV